MSASGPRPRRPAITLIGSALALVAAVARPDPLPMWEVTDAAGKLYILGSIHFLKAGRDALPQGIVDAYREADVLVMEIDLEDVDPVAAATTMQRLGMDPQGRDLAQLLGPRDYALAAAKAKTLGIAFELVQPFEPWLAALTITQMQLDKLGYAADSGVERQLVALAQTDQKEVRGLETVEEQLGAMDALPPAAQRAFLMETLDEAATMGDQVDDIVAAWKRGDTRTMETEFLSGLQDQPDLYQRIVVARNRDWATKLEVLIRDRHDYLVVVGTLHLVGPDSLISMLGRAGHASRQVGVEVAGR